MEAFSLATLLLGPAALILMLWQWPNGARLHVRACLAGASIWCALALWDPGLDGRQAFLPALFMFLMALYRPAVQHGPPPSRRGPLDTRTGLR